MTTTIVYLVCYVSQVGRGLKLMATNLKKDKKLFLLGSIILLCLFLLVMHFATNTSEGWHSFLGLSHQKHFIEWPKADYLKISPDGKWVAFTARLWPFSTGPLLIVNLASGETWSAEYYDKWEVYYATCWSKDGKRVLFFRGSIRNGHTKGVYSVSVPDFTINRIDLPELENAYGPVWSPDQKQIVYRIENGSTGEPGNEKAIYIAPSKGGDSHIITKASDVIYKFWLRPYEDTYRLFIKEHRRKSAEGTLELFSPDGSHLATLAKSLTSGVTALSADGCRFCLLERKDRLRVYRLDEPGTAPKMIKLPDELDDLKFSGSGYQLIGWGWARGRLVPRQLWLIDTDSMSIRRIGKREWYPAFQGIEWMPNGKEILVSSEDKLWIVDIVSGAKRQVWQFPEKYKRIYYDDPANINLPKR